MKIIFLDMDGVLTCTRTHVANRDGGLWHRVDRTAVLLLNRLHDGHDDVRYVLISTWRKFHIRTQMEILLRDAGWTGEFHEDWKTGQRIIKFSQVADRGHEVRDWLDGHNEVESYVIIDDMDASCFSEVDPPVVTDINDGFSLKNLDEAYQKLHGVGFTHRSFKRNEISVLAYQDGAYHICQGIEHNVSAQGTGYGAALDNFVSAMTVECQHTGECQIDPASEKFAEMWSDTEYPLPIVITKMIAGKEWLINLKIVE